MNEFEPMNHLEVVAVGEDGARSFVTSYLGVPPERIERVEDGGPHNRPERYKDEARTWHVYLKPPVK